MTRHERERQLTRRFHYLSTEARWWDDFSRLGRYGGPGKPDLPPMRHEAEKASRLFDAASRTFDRMMEIRQPGWAALHCRERAS